jgi:kanamycin kinase
VRTQQIARHYCGYVDLGDLGVADRWAGLAVAKLSLRWNHPGRRLWQAEDQTSR